MRAGHFLFLLPESLNETHLTTPFLCFSFRLLLLLLPLFLLFLLSFPFLIVEELYPRTRQDSLNLYGRSGQHESLNSGTQSLTHSLAAYL